MPKRWPGEMPSHLEIHFKLLRIYRGQSYFLVLKMSGYYITFQYGSWVSWSCEFCSRNKLVSEPPSRTLVSEDQVHHNILSYDQYNLYVYQSGTTPVYQIHRAQPSLCLIQSCRGSYSNSPCLFQFLVCRHIYERSSHISISRLQRQFARSKSSGLNCWGC